jgi:large subunit ribosomal protein L23
MGIFTKKKAVAAPAKAKAAKKSVEKTEIVGAGSVRASNASIQRAMLVLSSPRVSEKAAILASKGTYVFNVPVTAEKIEIRKAVEAMYNVHVERVNTVRGIGKVVRRGRTEGRRNNWKKALVTLKKGEKIDLYEGV